MFVGAEELGGAEAGGGDVASSSSSIILAVTVAADEENSESSSDGVLRITALLGGVVSNLNRSVKPSTSSSLQYTSLIALSMYNDRFHE